ncbi:putative subtilisin-like serine protease pr1c protein [Neofusicoccum parvum]|uniref:Subtilisin-like serine protease pr1c protein n=1 Tax=Neofusicoccum parvum TaxID=310453 RepID=A0ACB5SDM1_9PEZI|nr:putative subtilisin-like serine protease pr1c protein [Neofusicoccum parvum]
MAVMRQVNEATAGGLGPVEITKRLDFTSNIFSGASFAVTAVNGPADDDEFRRALEDVPEIKAVYPINTYYLTGSEMRASPYGSGDVFEEQLERRQEPEASPQDSIDTIFSTHVMTGVDRLHAENITGAGVKIAILDTGIDYLHPALGAGFGAGFKVVGGTDLVGDKYNGSSNVPASPDNDPLVTCSDHGTHVSGIIGANPYRYNVTGVAPDAELEMYRVFGCSGGVNTDIGVNASLQAYNSGADIIHASIGGNGGWSDDAWAVVVDRINGNGTLYTLSAGNSGNNVGIFGPNSLGGGSQTPLIGAVDNTQTPELLLNATYRIGDEQVQDFQFAPGWPQNFTVDQELYALSFDDDDSSDACEELPDSTPDLSNRIVLVRRRIRCSTSTKITNVQRAGGRYILVYNIADDNPILPLSYLDNSGDRYEWREKEVGPLLQGVGMVDNAVGQKWIDNLKNGSRVTATLPTSVDNKQLRYKVNNQTGGRMSRFTSWGPTYEAQPGVTVSGPGGNILSTLSRRVGGYGTYSGTSMSGPFLAGVAALIKSANPSISVPDIISRLAVTANPMPFNDNSTTAFDYLAPVFQQGGGLVDAYQAVKGTTLLNASSLNFNDTAFTNSPQHFTISNTGTASLTYNLSHIGAGTVYALPEGDPGTNSPLGLNDDRFVSGLSKAFATVTISPTTVDIAAGDSATISVDLSFPDLDRRRIPLVSGYIAANASDGTSVTLPYNGVASALRNAIVLDPNTEGNYLIAATNASLNTTNFFQPAPPGSGSVLSVPKVTNTSLLNEVVLPGVQFILAMGSRRVDFDVLRANSSENVGTAVVLNPSPLYVRSYTRASANVRLFYGMLANMTYVPEGEYKFLVRALRITGDPENLDDYDSFTTDSFFLRYTEQ